MARSCKKSPAGGNTTASDRPGKTRAHRRTRRATVLALARGDEEMPDHRATENPWAYPKDGHAWYRSCRPEWLRK